jgi:hypothetical protein
LKKLMCLCAAVIAGSAFAMGVVKGADLPKSGSFSIHSGWKSIGEVSRISDNHTYGFGSFWGVSYNDAGSGALHTGPVVCPYTLEVISGAGTGQGSCAWGDAEGDKIFTSWSGSLTPAGEFSGMNQITGGTGKFKGIQGKAPFQCKALNEKGQWTCKQQFEYRLP